ncbi:SDR family NAD(P)-dependent oxidoreductase [Pseudonocardia endophytica]|uniref:NAD(P)-dependent dehydrogenase (Short-subunit alcohol dehydrogenase family) n=1 Tax=Pseudonocardia endophytica TaxID=401976 RepID=A0A4R1HPX1_PSEEN|nr:SDR family oxidoreductase [Pseudonocardia endophytica]TCK24617.1 NAD(P)-dependent dehydrogenase (short-subunit alcohol dehydrogenase family) [Pseudonocardia endophytica]
MPTFSGKTAIVSGAAGGIGGGAALRLAEGGADLALFDLDESAIEPTAEKCRAAGAEVLTARVDQTDSASVQQGIDRTVEHYGGVDILSANAGYCALSTLLDQPLEEWNKHLAVNLTGTMLLAQGVARNMVERKSGGAIVIVSSGAAVQHVDQASAYSVSKAGVKMLTEGLASELGPHRIRVNGIMPGLIETGMVSPIFDLSSTSKARLIAGTPVGHLGTPDDVGALVAFLASSDARYINGHSVMIDGGALLHDFQWFHQDYTQSHDENWTMI